MSEERDPGLTPACVVVDCNEWLRLKWLGSSIGTTFIAVLRREPDLRLAIAEVLERELDKHRAATGRALLDRLTDVVSEIQTVTGQSHLGGAVLATEEAIDVAIRERLSSVSARVLYPPMTLDEARRALHRVNAETPPNGPKNQQMKDSLLWEACLSLAAHYRVFFVTADKGFYADRDVRKGLARNLATEAPVESGRLQVFPSLEQAMSAFAPETSVDAGATGELANEGVEDLIGDRAAEALRRSAVAENLRPAFTLRGVVPHYLQTDVPHVFAVSFTAFFYVNRGVADRPHGEVAVTGDCRLDTRELSIDAVSMQTIHWTLNHPDGGANKVREVLDGPPQRFVLGSAIGPGSSRVRMSGLRRVHRARSGKRRSAPGAKRQGADGRRSGPRGGRRPPLKMYGKFSRAVRLFGVRSQDLRDRSVSERA